MMFTYVSGLMGFSSQVDVCRMHWAVRNHMTACNSFSLNGCVFIFLKDIFVSASQSSGKVVHRMCHCFIASCNTKTRYVLIFSRQNVCSVQSAHILFGHKAQALHQHTHTDNIDKVHHIINYILQVLT